MEVTLVSGYDSLSATFNTPWFIFSRFHKYLPAAKDISKCAKCATICSREPIQLFIHASESQIYCDQTLKGIIWATRWI